MERTKTTERKWFTRDDKIFILDKSHGKCSHCGKNITIGDNFTVEHAIPISKGGTNDAWNIVALCDECNQNKSDDIINPIDYYTYLDEEHLKQLYNKQCEYYKNVNWLDKCNFTKEDRKLLKVSALIPGALKTCMRYGTIGTRDKALMFVNFVMEKAKYSDLDETVNVYKKYMRKFGVNISQKHVHKLISEVFSKGVIYTLRNSSKEIVGVLPVALVCSNNKSYILKVFTPAYSKPRSDYFLAINTALDVIIDNIFELHLVEGYVPILMDFCAADTARIRVSKSHKFKVDSMYLISNEMNRVMSEMSIYMPLNSDMKVEDYNKLIEDFSTNLMRKHNIQTNNIIDYEYDYWRD